MKRETDLTRRDFNRLTSAAFGGMLAGSMAGCSQEPAPKKVAEGGAEEGKKPAEGGEPDINLILQEKHICKGLNQCKGKGKSGNNECKGMGDCHTAEAHSCHGENQCKGQGGCEDLVGLNECKGKGNCGVPLNPTAWKKARATFEKAMAAKDESVGQPPE